MIIIVIEGRPFQPSDIDIILTVLDSIKKVDDFIPECKEDEQPSTH